MLYYEQYYVKAALPETSVKKELFINGAFNDEILARANTLISKEAPILKEDFNRRILASFNMSKSSSTQKIIDKVIAQIDIKQTQQRGSVVYWNKFQNPDSWLCFRSNPERVSDEIPLVEVKNAICYVLQQNGAMLEGDAIKSASLLLGYKKLGSNLKKSFIESLKLAISNNEISTDNGIITLKSNSDDSSESADNSENYINTVNYKNVEPNYDNNKVDGDKSDDDLESETGDSKGIISVIADELSVRRNENKQLSEKIQQEKEKLKSKREKSQNRLINKVKPIGLISKKIGEKQDSKQLEEYISSETKAIHDERSSRFEDITINYLKKIVIVVIALIFIIASFIFIKGIVKNNNIKNIQNQIITDIENPTQIAMRNFGIFEANVPSDWIINEEIDNSEKANGTFKDPVTIIQRFLKDKDGDIIVAEDIRYLGEDLGKSATSKNTSLELMSLADGDNLIPLKTIPDSSFLELKNVKEESWSFTSSNDTYRVYSYIIQLDDSYYAISCLFDEDYYTDELFIAMVSNAGTTNYHSAVPTKLNVSYDGSVRIDTKINKDNKGLKITADFDNGLSKNVLNKATITGDSDTLELGKTNNFTVSYSYADTTIDEHLSISCASTLSNLKVYYNGPTAKGTEINDLKEFIVKAVYVTPEEDDYEKDVTERCSLVEPGTLEANKTHKYAITYGEKTASYNVECSTKATIEAVYNGSNASGTEITSLDNFVVTATFTDDNYPEINTTEDVTDKAKLENTATLSAGREYTFTISYLGATTTCSISCPADEKSNTEEIIRTYVVNTSTGVFHNPGCYHIRRMNANNRWDYEGTREWLIDNYYTPCGYCNP